MYLIKISVGDIKTLAKQAKPFFKMAGRHGSRIHFFSEGLPGDKLVQVVCEYQESACFEPGKETIGKYRFESMLVYARDQEVPECSTTVGAFEALVGMAKNLSGDGSATLELDVEKVQGAVVVLQVYSGKTNILGHVPGHLTVSTQFDG